MDTANTIKELRESIGMSRKEFSEHTGIPVRTLEDWEAARRTPPEYISRLIVKTEENNRLSLSWNLNCVISKLKQTLLKRI